jgi:serine/threonine protein kinase
MKNTSKGIVAGSGDSFTQPVARTPSQIAVLRRTIPCRTILETPSCPQELKKGAIGWSMEGLKVQRVLGEGALSTVVQATCNLTGSPMALKIYHRDRLNSLNVRQISREIEIHASVTHPNVIKLYAAFEDADGIYLVQEFAAGGTFYFILFYFILFYFILFYFISFHFISFHSILFCE